MTTGVVCLPNDQFAKVSRRVSAAVLFTLTTTACNGAFQASRSDSLNSLGIRTQSTIAHGKDLTLNHVGPRALGVTSFSEVSGGINIYPETTAAYMRKVEDSATYDGFTVNGPHWLIQGVSFTGQINSLTPLPVVIRGCRVRVGGYWSIMTYPDAGPIYVLYSDLGGTSLAAEGQSGVIINTANLGGNVFFRNYLSYGGDGFAIDSKGDSIIENYVEKFNPGNDVHNDGIQARGANDGLYVSRNKILVDQTQTAAINLVPISTRAQNVIVDANYLAGGAYAFVGGQSELGPSSGLVITNNIFGDDFFVNSGFSGPVTSWEMTGVGNLWTNNRDNYGRSVGP